MILHIAYMLCQNKSKYLYDSPTKSVFPSLAHALLPCSNWCSYTAFRSSERPCVCPMRLHRVHLGHCIANTLGKVLQNNFLVLISQMQWAFLGGWSRGWHHHYHFKGNSNENNNKKMSRTDGLRQIKVCGTMQCYGRDLQRSFQLCHIP